MKIYQITPGLPVIEPEIVDDKTFSWIGRRYIAVLSGDLPVQEHVTEIDWSDDRALRDHLVELIGMPLEGTVEFDIKSLLAEPTEAEVMATLAEDIRVHVETYIRSKASLNTQINMAAAAAADLFDVAETQAYLEGLSWVNAVRQKGRDLALAGDLTYREAHHWPEPSAAALALAEAY